MYVIGDVAVPFVNRPSGVAPDASEESELTESSVTAVNLPAIVTYQTRTGFTAAVTTSAIDAKENLVGFQGDLTFDERVIQFASTPIEQAGLTAENWTVAGNVLPGEGPIRTLRISAFSNDFIPLSGSGTLFELKIAQVNQGRTFSSLVWALPPDDFIFINADLQIQRPRNAP